jgi:hypothetical protein
MGTGVGEAMLIGAAVGATAGGAGAAIQGGDPMKGALTGGAMGAVGGGLGAAAGAGGGAAAGAGSGAGAGAGGGAAGAGAGAGTGSVFGGTAGTAGGATSLGTSIGGVSGGSGTLGSAGFGATSGGTAGGTAGGATGGTAGGTGSFGIGQGVNYANFANTAGSSAYGGMGGAGAGTTAAGGFGIAAPTTSASLSGAGAGTTGGTTGGAASTGAEKNVFGYKPTDAGYLSNTQLGMTAGTAALSGAMGAERDMYGNPPNEDYDGPLSKLKYDPDKFKSSNPTYAPSSVYRPTYAAEGGIMQVYQSGGPVERMSQMNTAMNPQGGLYPQGMIDKTQYATPTQRPVSSELVMEAPAYERSNPMLMARGGIARYDVGGMTASGIPDMSQQAAAQSATPQGLEALMGGRKKRLSKEELESSQMQGLTPAAYNSIYGEGVKAEQSMAGAGLARGGISSLGSYSDGGRMLKGPGDGMSDNIPATIAGKQPARLADGEFVIPADVVSHLGNGSTDAGAKQLYAMMNRVRKARTGNSKQGKQIKPSKYMVA